MADLWQWKQVAGAPKRVAARRRSCVDAISLALRVPLPGDTIQGMPEGDDGVRVLRRYEARSIVTGPSPGPVETPVLPALTEMYLPPSFSLHLHLE